MPSPVELEADSVVGAYVGAVEATDTAGVIYITLFHLYAFRCTYILTFHAADTFVGVNGYVHQRLRMQAAKGCPDGTDCGAEASAAFPCTQ